MMKGRLFVCLLLFSIAYAPSSLFSQAAEINPYGGFHWPGDNDEVGRFQSNQLLGVRGGAFITPNFEIGGNYSWWNHFQPKSDNGAASLAGSLNFPQGAVRANLWEAEFSYNFGKRNLFGTTGVKPYIVGGIGGLTTRIKKDDVDTFVLNVRPVTPNSRVFVANDVLESKDTFLTFSYGGGLKSYRVWGPMGFFGDVRGRSIPNFFSHGTNFLELSAGLTFAWGEK